jgi:hypothetical protein
LATNMFSLGFLYISFISYIRHKILIDTLEALPIESTSIVNQAMKPGCDRNNATSAIYATISS